MPLIEKDICILSVKSDSSVLVSNARDGNLTRAYALSMRAMLERIYIDCRFRNDMERLEKLFEMYTKMTKTKEAA